MFAILLAAPTNITIQTKELASNAHQVVPLANWSMVCSQLFLPRVVIQ
jgi:hypothetical protein